MKSKRKIFLHGWYGCNNSGDDALLSIISKTITQAVSGVEITIQVPQSGQLPPLPDCVNVNRISPLFKGYVTLRKILAILASDILIFGGGSIMTDINEQRMKGLRSLHCICRFAKFKGVPIIFTGLGVGPFVSQKGIDLAKSVLDMAEVVELRDKTSYELCKKISVSSHIVESFDPAVLLHKELQQSNGMKSRDNKVPIIGISLSESSGTISSSKEKEILKIDRLVCAIKDVCRLQSICIAGIEMCSNTFYSDAEILKILLGKLQNICEVKYIRYQPDPVKMLHDLSILDGIIAERLHAAIFAYIVGTPFAVIPYHSKCAAFAKDVGLSGRYLLDTEIRPDQIKEVIMSQINDGKLCLPKMTIEEACSKANLGQDIISGKIKHLLFK
ncbi:MAG: hypothetical protein A2Y13_11590 [Planctomycetes bacterium GWC2_45_44]|nr:MAG: hypothetical protein A2Y13_11590 [Planctomycetes bacterium GWC2_45_44]HBR18947.1 hypothetical protein [Phycisphaerales bacterium]